MQRPYTQGLGHWSLSFRNKFHVQRSDVSATKIESWHKAIMEKGAEVNRKRSRFLLVDENHLRWVAEKQAKNCIDLQAAKERWKIVT